MTTLRRRVRWPAILVMLVLTSACMRRVDVPVSDLERVSSREPTRFVVKTRSGGKFSAERLVARGDTLFVTESIGSYPPRVVSRSLPIGEIESITKIETSTRVAVAVVGGVLLAITAWFIYLAVQGGDDIYTGP